MIISTPYIIAFLVVVFLLCRIHQLSVAVSDLKVRLSYIDNRLQEHLVAYSKRVRYQDYPELEAEDKRLAKFQQEMMMGASEKDMLWSKNPELLRNSDEAKRYNEIVKNL